MKKLISLILVLSMILLYSMNYLQEIKSFLREDLFNKNIEAKDDNDINKKQIENFKKIKIGDSKKLVIEKIYY